MSSLEGNVKNLIISNSVAGAYLPYYWLDNPNVHWLLTPEKLPTPALPKRLHLIFYHRVPIYIVNSLLNTVYIVGGQWGTHSYSSSPKHNNEADYFRNGLLSL